MGALFFRTCIARTGQAQNLPLQLSSLGAYALSHFFVVLHLHPAIYYKEEGSMEDNRKKEITWATLCHVAALSLYVGIPFGHIIVPLVIWLIKKNEFPFVDEQGKESLNFQISMTIYGIITGLLCYLVIGFALLPVLVIIHIALIVTAIIKTNKGEQYRYPFTIRIIK